MKLQGKIAGITGGGAGFGRAMALAFSREGADVAVCDLELANAEATAGMVRESGRRSMAYDADVTDTPRLRSFVEEIVSEFGRIDIWVGNAGKSGGSPAEDEDESFWNEMMDLDLSAVFFGAQAAGRQMLRQGSGSIINIASMYGMRASAGRVAYCTAKAGVIMLSQCLAVEWGGRGVRVNSIGPGYADTELFRRGRAAHSLPVDDLLDRVPIRRFVTEEEVAAAATFLASDDASFVNGHCLIVDGGWTPRGA